ncbi:hypothetical protein JCM13580A_39190 [Streptomyces drozdowiczii]
MTPRGVPGFLRARPFVCVRAPRQADLTAAMNGAQAAASRRRAGPSGRIESRTGTRPEANGITLPSLGVDPLTLAGWTSRPPLVALGNCNTETARRLAEVLERAAGG